MYYKSFTGGVFKLYDKSSLTGVIGVCVKWSVGVDRKVKSVIKKSKEI